MKTILLLAAINPLFSAIPGVPEIPSGQSPNLIVAWSNDWFAFPSGMQQTETSNLDDFRTNSFTFTLLTGPYRFVLDDSMLTSRELELRADEITGTVGYDYGQCSLGGGMRLRGDYKGQQLQNWWHDVLGDTPLNCVSEGSRIDAVVYCQPWLQSYRIDHRLSLDPFASLMLATNTELAADAGCHVVYNGDGINSWLGFRYQWRDGATSELIRKVQSHERGARLDYGFATHGGFSFSCVYDPNGATGIGQMAYSF